MPVRASIRRLGLRTNEYFRTVEIHHHPIRVLPAHIDARGHVNNVVYLQWVQDAAEAHWKSKAQPAVLAAFAWVVVRHEIDYNAPAYLDDDLLAKTWVDNYEGVRSTRIVQIFRADNDKVLAEARTTWCLLNAQTGRPTRITDEIRSTFLSARS